MIRFLAIQHTFSEFFGALEPQGTAARVVAALVDALDLMQERRKMPVFGLKTVKRDE
jgi:hypothetical protein